MGRDSGDLTEAGRQYSILLTRFIKAQQEDAMLSGNGTRGHDVLILAGTQQVIEKMDGGLAGLTLSTGVVFLPTCLYFLFFMPMP